MGADSFLFLSPCKEHGVGQHLVCASAIDSNRFVVGVLKTTQQNICTIQLQVKSFPRFLIRLVSAKIYLILASTNIAMKPKFIAALFGLTAATGCYYQNEEELYNCSIDAVNIRYSTTINTIFNSYGCIGCHGTLAPAGNIVLNTYAGVKSVATNGKLFGAISHAPGYEPMPQGSGKMNACDIRRVKAWIDAGAPNN